jgi:hypothetical protein
MSLAYVGAQPPRERCAVPGEVDCELHSLDLCANDADFVITNSTCAVFGARS